VPTGKVDGRTTGARADKPTTSWKVRQIVRQATTITHVLFFFFNWFEILFFSPGPRNSIWIFLDLSGFLDLWLLVFNLGLPVSRFSGLDEIFLRFKNTGLEDGTDWDAAWSGTGSGIAINT
jgi:hypothetical protein